MFPDGGNRAVGVDETYAIACWLVDSTPDHLAANVKVKAMALDDQAGAAPYWQNSKDIGQGDERLYYKAPKRPHDVCEPLPGMSAAAGSSEGKGKGKGKSKSQSRRKKQ